MMRHGPCVCNFPVVSWTWDFMEHGLEASPGWTWDLDCGSRTSGT